MILFFLHVSMIRNILYTQNGILHMHAKTQYIALIASVMLILPSTAFADQGAGSQTAIYQLQPQLASITCSNAYLTGYLNDVVTAISNSTITAAVSSDLTKLGTDFSALQADANSGNISQFKTDAKTYNVDSKTANHDALSAIKAAHSKTVNTTLQSDKSKLKSDQDSCLFAAKQQKAQLKIQNYNTVLSHATNMTGKLAKHGANTTTLSQTINTASAQVQAFQNAVKNAQNSTQLQTALNSFCLYNACKTPNNFHFAAITAIQANQAKLSLLASKNTTSSYQGLVSQAQADLAKAQTALNQVGSNQYQGTQSNDVWNNIKASVDVIHQLQQIINHKH